MNRLLQLSGVIVDLVYEVESVPQPGEEAAVTGFHMSAGGGFNAMVAARRSKMHTTYGGSLGQGPLADMVFAQLQKENISMLPGNRKECDQGCCTVLVDSSGERTFIAREGAEGMVSPEQLAAIDPRTHDWILISGYALVYEHSREAVSDFIHQLPADSNVVFDPCPLVASIPEPILHKVMTRSVWVSCNDTEARYLTGANDAAAAARILASATPGTRGCVVRQGRQGCTLALNGENAIGIPGYQVNAIDTNGAGDSHVGTFIACLASGKEPQAACNIANAAAALSTTNKGPATTPRLAEVQAYISRFDSTHAGKSTHAME